MYIDMYIDMYLADARGIHMAVQRIGLLLQRELASKDTLLVAATDPHRVPPVRAIIQPRAERRRSARSDTARRDRADDPRVVCVAE